MLVVDAGKKKAIENPRQRSKRKRQQRNNYQMHEEKNDGLLRKC